MFSLFGVSLVVHEISTWAGRGPDRYVSDKSFKFYSSASQTMSLLIVICFICYLIRKKHIFLKNLNRTTNIEIF